MKPRIEFIQHVNLLKVLVKPACGLVFFVYSGVVLASGNPLDLLWPKDITAQASNPETLKLFPKKMSWQKQFEQWQDEKKTDNQANYQVKGNHQALAFGLLHGFEQDGFNFRLFYQNQTIEQFWFEQNQQDQVRYGYQHHSENFALNVDSRWLGFGGFSENSQHGYSAQLNLLPQIKLFYKTQPYNQTWLLEADIAKQQSSGLLNFRMPFPIQCDFKGQGILLSGDTGWLQAQHLDAEGCEKQQLEGVLRFEAVEMALIYDRFDFSPRFSTIWVDNVNHNLNEYWGGYERKEMRLALNSSARQWHVFGGETFFDVNIQGRMRLNDTLWQEADNVFADFLSWWTALFYFFRYDPVVTMQSRFVGLGSKATAQQGWQNAWSLGYAKLDMHAEMDYWIANKDLGSAQLDVSSVELALLDLGFGYAWKNWRWFYRIQQPIPLSISERKAAETADNGEGGGNVAPDESDTGKENVEWPTSLPPGFRHSLILEYRF